jgi:hypothetical protein
VLRLTYDGRVGPALEAILEGATRWLLGFSGWACYGERITFLKGFGGRGFGAW